MSESTEDSNEKKERMRARLKARKEQKNRVRQELDKKTSQGIDPNLFTISKVGDYRLLTLIGKGGAGSVHRGVHMVTNNVVAVKRINLHGVGQADRESMESEIELLKHFKHPNIVQYIDSIQIAGSLNIILELVDGGTLNDQLSNFSQRPDRLIAYYLVQVLQGLKYLHEQGVIHRDIKGANLLSNKDGIVKLADFGVAKQLGKVLKTHSVVGTPYWMAPEIIQMSSKQSPACDIWSVGCTVLELLTGKPPFFDSNPMSALYKMVQCDHPPFPDNLSPDLTDFLLQCLQRDPAKRATAEQLLQHKWLQIDMSEGADLARASVIVQQQKWRERQEATERKRTLEDGSGMKRRHGTGNKSLDPKEQLDMDDMVGMDRMTADLVLTNIKVRFHRDSIYTNIGSILIAVNPYRDIEGLYTEKMYAKYHYLKAQHSELPPHIFKIAKAAYWGATALDLPKGANRNQAILISGESGAGKTEATKTILGYITKMTAPQAGKNLNALLAEDAIKSIEDKLLQANPILEAFGNAKTLRNDNSSRFGKWITITLAKRRRTDIFGASIVKYLLEESRVCAPTAGERNYNIFYQVCADCISRDPNSEYNPLNFNYLTTNKNDRESITIKGVDDNVAFQSVVQAMWCLGIGESERSQIVDIVKGILKLGNVKFSAAASGSSTVISEGTEEFLDSASKLLGCEKPLKEALLYKVRIVKGSETIRSERTPKEAAAVRDSVSKTLYGRLFTWLVSRINQAIARSVEPSHMDMQAAAAAANAAAMERDREMGLLPVTELGEVDFALPEGLSLSSARPLMKHARSLSVNSLEFDEPGATIGILDIFGFEAFDTNSFEQLCINFANEQLQQFFVHFIFKMEQALYQQEALNVDKMSYTDNKDCVELLGGKPAGVFALLADEMTLPGASDANFVQKLHHQHEKNPFYEKPIKTGRDCFTIRHYPQQVTYDVTGFLEKNQASIGEDVMASFVSSTVPLVENLFNVDLEDEEEKGKFSTSTLTSAPGTLTSATSSRNLKKKPKGGLGAQFQESLRSLLSSLTTATPHFVRCIKPNANKTPYDFDSELVIRQLRTSGMLDSVAVRKLGYPDRMEHKAFLARYEQQYIRKHLRGQHFELPPLARKDVLEREEDENHTGGQEGGSRKDSAVLQSPVAQPSISSEDADGRVKAFLAKDQRARITELLEAATAIAKQKLKSSSQMELWQLGTTRVFLKPEIYRELEADRAGLLYCSVLTMQRFIRGHLARSKLFQMIRTLKQLNRAVGDADLQAIDVALLDATRAGLVARMVNSFWDQRQHIERTLKNNQELVDALVHSVPSLAVRLASLSLAINKSQTAQIGYSDAQGMNLLNAAKQIYSLLTKFMRSLTSLVERAPFLDVVGLSNVTSLLDLMTSQLDGVFRRVKAEEWGLIDEELEAMIRVLIGEAKDVEELQAATKRITELSTVSQALDNAMDMGNYDLDSGDFSVVIGCLTTSIASAEQAKLENSKMEQARGLLEALKLQTLVLKAQKSGNISDIQLAIAGVKGALMLQQKREKELAGHLQAQEESKRQFDLEQEEREKSLHRRKSRRRSTVQFVPVPVTLKTPSQFTINDCMAASKIRLQLHFGDSALDMAATSVENALVKLESLLSYVNTGLQHLLALRELLAHSGASELDSPRAQTMKSYTHPPRDRRSSIGGSLPLLHEIKAYLSSREELSNYAPSPTLVSLYQRAENMLASHATSALLHALVSEDTAVLETALKQATKAGLAPEELQVASRRLTYLQTRQQLLKALESHDGNTIEATLRVVEHAIATGEVDANLLKVLVEQARRVHELLNFLCAPRLEGKDPHQSLAELRALIQSAKAVGATEGQLTTASARMKQLQEEIAEREKETAILKEKLEAERKIRLDQEEIERLHAVRDQMERAELQAQREREAYEEELLQEQLVQQFPDGAERPSVDKLKEITHESFGHRTALPTLHEANESGNASTEVSSDVQGANNSIEPGKRNLALEPVQATSTSPATSPKLNGSKSPKESPKGSPKLTPKAGASSTLAFSLGPSVFTLSGVDGSSNGSLTQPAVTRQGSFPESPLMQKQVSLESRLQKQPSFESKLQLQKQLSAERKAVSNDFTPPPLASTARQEVRGFTHWPTVTTDHGPCVICRKDTNFQCQKCALSLCPAPCLEVYHNQ